MRSFDVIRWALPLAGAGAGVWLAAFGTLPANAQPAGGRESTVPETTRPPAPDLRRESLPAAPAQCAAATTAAIDNLRDEIAREPLTPRMTVGDFLRRAGGTDTLVRELARTDPLGGTRWLDGQTCQVQLEISGSRLSRVMEQIAANKGSPLTPVEIEQLTVDWRRRNFSATGSSTDFAHVAAARPRSSNTAWLGVLDTDRRRALAAARDDAFAHVLSSVRLIPLGRTAVVGDALAVEDIHTAVINWLSSVPVTRVNYRRDLQVELTFSATPDGLFDVFRAALDRHPEFDRPVNEAEWARVRRAFVDRMEPAAGRGVASPDVAPRVVGPAVVPPANNPGARAVAPEPVHIPLGIPRWAGDQIAATGIIDAAASKLKAARQAEALARRRLTEQVEALPLTRTQTVGEAAARDPKVRDAITRAVDRARVEKTDYYHGSDVKVELRLELRDVWDELKSLP